ncbi:hypothetical protein, partial [Pseudomonas aeruginosa]|uniref:hypothetical protein n=1 Tax=Pseudomonas aeruginosa TaxID=287 RepID=UPI0019554225
PAPGTIVFPRVQPIPVKKVPPYFFPQFLIISAIFYFVGFTFLPFRSRISRSSIFRVSATRWAVR